MKYSLMVLRRFVIKRFIIMSLVGLLIGLGTLATTASPSYAQVPLNSKETGATKTELTGRLKDTPLSDEEKLDRAYMFREGVGLQEEKRQQEKNAQPRKGNRSSVEKANDAVKETVDSDDS